MSRHRLILRLLLLAGVAGAVLWAAIHTWLGLASRTALSGETTAIRDGMLALGVLAAIVFLPRLFGGMRPGNVTAWIEPEELRRGMQRDEAPTVLDVRGADEFVGPLGHIPGATNVPLGELERRLNDVRAIANSRIAVVCRTDKRSAMAQVTLRAAGFDGVVVLRGGMERWSALGFDTVRDKVRGSSAIARDE